MEINIFLRKGRVIRILKKMAKFCERENSEEKVMVTACKVLTCVIDTAHHPQNSFIVIKIDHHITPHSLRYCPHAC